MEERAARLNEYVQDRIGESLRAVGYHTETDVGLVYIRDELVEQYPKDRVERFIQASRGVHTELTRIDEGMGAPKASLHLLDDGLIAQFHYGGRNVVFLSMDRSVGLQFTRFMEDCRIQMG